jgi:hypothetical protein
MVRPAVASEHTPISNNELQPNVDPTQVHLVVTTTELDILADALRSLGNVEFADRLEIIQVSLGRRRVMSQTPSRVAVVECGYCGRFGRWAYPSSSAQHRFCSSWCGGAEDDERDEKAEWAALVARSDAEQATIEESRLQENREAETLVEESKVTSLDPLVDAELL